MVSPFDMLAALCGPSGASIPQGGLLLGLLLAGAAGSPMHCVPMCGGFVLGQVADRMALLPAARLCEWRRMRAGMLLPYHLGRLTTYAWLGALAGLGGATIARLAWFGWLSGVLLLLAAVMFLGHGLRRLLPGAGIRGPVLTTRGRSAWNRMLGRVTRDIDRTRWGGGYALGLALGFLPCGFLYAALAAAASSCSVGLGAAAMVAFGLGTAPALMVAGVAGQAAGQRWQRGMAAVAPAVMLLNAALLAALALRHFVINA